MPNASARVLGKAVLFELERLSPLKPAAIVHDIHVVKRDRPLNQAVVEVRMIRRDLLESAAAQCRSLGLHIAGLRLPGLSSGRRWTAYPVKRFAALRLRANRWATAGLSGLALLLLGCTVTAEYMRGAVVQQRIAAELEAERIRANAVPPIRQRIEEERNQILHFVRQRNSTLYVVLLTEISAILPDSAWTTRVEISSENIRIQGFARTPSELIPLFEKSPHFINAHFGQPVAPKASDGPEAFDLTFNIAVPL